MATETRRETRVFSASSIPFEVVPWGRTKVLVGVVEDDSRFNAQVMVKITENAAGDGGNHRMHSHPTQDEILYVIDGHGENVSEDGTVRPFGPGDIVYIPAGVPHEDRSVGGPVTLLVIKAPADGAESL